MLTALKPEDIDFAAADEIQRKYAPNVNVKEISQILNDIAKIKPQDRKTHVIIKDLTKAKVDFEKKKDEPQKTLTKYKTQVDKKEVDKIKQNLTKYHDFIKALTNQDAKRFFLTYYSGELKKAFDFTDMFSNFINFIDNVCGIKM